MDASGQRGGALKVGRNAVDWLFCRDGLWRPVEPGTFPLADAVAGRVGRLRAYGNGLDFETAAEFYGAALDLMCGI
jgi:DNA (cytosine-5)-methyltransferase 1